MTAPYSYEQINAHVSPVTPSVMHTKGNGLSYYFRKYLFLEAISMVRWTLPDTWPSNRLQYLVFGDGGVTVFDTDRYGLVYDRMGLTGINIFYNPTHSIVANPFIKGSPYLQIGRQCEIINLQPDYRGMVDIVAYYGDMMALAAQTIQSNLINSRLAYVFAAGNKAGAESFKKCLTRSCRVIPLFSSIRLCLKPPRPGPPVSPRGCTFPLTSKAILLPMSC